MQSARTQRHDLEIVFEMLAAGAVESTARDARMAFTVMADAAEIAIRGARQEDIGAEIDMLRLALEASA